jgi:hypothetical protein
LGRYRQDFRPRCCHGYSEDLRANRLQVGAPGRAVNGPFVRTEQSPQYFVDGLGAGGYTTSLTQTRCEGAAKALSSGGHKKIPVETRE